MGGREKNLWRRDQANNNNGGSGWVGLLAQENRIWAVGLGGEYAAFAFLAKTAAIKKQERENGRVVKFWDTRALQSKIPNSKL